MSKNYIPNTIDLSDLGKVVFVPTGALKDGVEFGNDDFYVVPSYERYDFAKEYLRPDFDIDDFETDYDGNFKGDLEDLIDFQLNDADFGYLLMEYNCTWDNKTRYAVINDIEDIFRLESDSKIYLTDNMNDDVFKLTISNHDKPVGFEAVLIKLDEKSNLKIKNARSVNEVIKWANENGVIVESTIDGIELVREKKK